MHPIKKNLYIKNCKKIKDPQYFLYIITKVIYVQKRQVDKITCKLKFENNNHCKNYNVDAICNSTVFNIKLISYLSDL